MKTEEFTIGQEIQIKALIFAGLYLAIYLFTQNFQISLFTPIILFAIAYVMKNGSSNTKQAGGSGTGRSKETDK